jgi:hypothetical protein
MYLDLSVGIFVWKHGKVIITKLTPGYHRLY